MSTSPRTVVITGASAGVGRAVARRFARDGTRIGLLARGRAGLQAVAAEVGDAGGTACVVPCDVADPDAVEIAARTVEDALGPIDVWINCAMTAVLAEVAQTPAEEFRRVTEVTYLGSVHGIQAALRRMLPRDRGHVIQVGSALAYRGIPLQATYCGAKHAIKGFCDSLQTELLYRHSHVRLSIVHLPGLNTTQFGWVRARTPNQPRPVAPVYQPEVAAETIHWVADHPRRSRSWVGGSTALTVIGSQLAPWLADRYLAARGVEGQQTDQPLEARPDDLDAPLDDERDHGLHGNFGAEAKDHSRQRDLARHRDGLLGGGAALLALAVGARWTR